MCFQRYLLLILVITTRVSSKHFTITGRYGDNVTLPCGYDLQAYGPLPFCWGRGAVPVSKCSNTLLSSADGAAPLVQPTGHRLMGRVGDGDVSLTILNAQRRDGGEYGCRVEIPGWFNDHKVNIQLVMEEVPAEPTTEVMTTTTLEVLQTSTSLQEDGDGAVPAEEAPLVVKIRSNSFPFEDSLGVWNFCRLAAVFFFTIVTVLVFALRRSFLQRSWTVEHLSISAAENIYAVIPDPQSTPSPHFYKT